MRVLHTADWHIGIQWHGVDRSGDLLGRAVPDVVDIALKKRVHLVLVAGDVFERQTNDSIQKAAQTLKEPFRELLNAGIHIALLLGNHDSAPLFQFLRGAVGLLDDRANNRGQLHVLNSTFITKISGLQIFHLPYMRAEQLDRNWNIALPDSKNAIENTNRQMGSMLDHLAKKWRTQIDHDKPALMTYHGIVRGSTIGADDRSHEFTYHQDFMLSPDTLLFNDQVPQYNALGHIHKCQELEGTVPTWYSGSIDRLDKGERLYEPSVILVEFPESGKRVTHERIRLSRSTPFLDEKIRTEVELHTLVEQFSQEECQRALGNITVECDQAEFIQLEQLIHESFPRLQGIRQAVWRARTVTSDTAETLNVIDVKELRNPAQTIRDYITKHEDENKAEGLLKALTVVEDKLNHDH